MSALAEAIESAAQEVGRAPQSPRAHEAVGWMIQRIDEFIAALPFATINELEPERRVELSRKLAEPVWQTTGWLFSMLSVADQMEQLGSHTAWGATLAEAVQRLENAFARLGVSVEPPKNGLPIVTRARTDGDFLIANLTRRPQLKPYVEAATRSARLQEVEPGHWYADLEIFPGVWADGTSPEECLATLADVLHEWLLIKLAHGDHDIPIIGHLDPTTLVRG
jgi:predicted RNase H-like HicB family nuclease